MQSEHDFIAVLIKDYEDIFKAVLENDFVVCIPSFENTLPEKIILDFHFMQEHILIQSQYQKNKLQNLNGKHYFLHKKDLQCTFGGSKKVKVKILSEDVCYCDSGQYKRIFIDGILDERYHQNKKTLPIHDKEILLDYQKIHDFQKFYSFFIKKNNLEFMVYEIDEERKLLQENCLFVKNFENEFAQQVHLLCKKLEKVFKGSQVPSTVVGDYDRANFIKKVCECGVILELHDFIFTNLIKFTAKDETKLQQKILNINLRNEFEATEFGMDLRLKDCKFKNSIHQFQQINNYNTPFQKLFALKKTNKYISLEAHKHLKKLQNGSSTSFSLNTDQLIPIWMHIILNSKVKNLLANKLYLEHFPYIKCSTNEMGFILINFIGVLENLMNMEMAEDGIIETKRKSILSTGINMFSDVDFDYFTKKKREYTLSHKIKSETINKSIGYTKTYTNHFQTDT